MERHELYCDAAVLVERGVWPANGPNCVVEPSLGFSGTNFGAALLYPTRAWPTHGPNCVVEPSPGLRRDQFWGCPVRSDPGLGRHMVRIVLWSPLQGFAGTNFGAALLDPTPDSADKWPELCCGALSRASHGPILGLPC